MKLSFQQVAKISTDSREREREPKPVKYLTISDWRVIEGVSSENVE